MAVVNIRQLSRNTSRVVGDVARTRKPALIMRSGKPVAALLAVDGTDWEDWILANAPEFIANLRQADEDIRLGRTITMDDYFAAQKPRRRVARRVATRTTRRSTR